MLEYDPSWLSDPQWPCGRHKRVLIFASYVVSFIRFLQEQETCLLGILVEIEL